MSCITQHSSTEVEHKVKKKKPVISEHVKVIFCVFITASSQLSPGIDPDFNFCEFFKLFL